MLIPPPALAAGRSAARLLTEAPYTPPAAEPSRLRPASPAPASSFARSSSRPPDLSKAAQSYRRNVATLRRAALRAVRRTRGAPTAKSSRKPGARSSSWQKLYDAYADGWADQPLTKDPGDQTAAELESFLAWTQLDRYVELAVLASTNAPRPSRPGQHVISAAKEVVSQPPVTEASPGRGWMADSEPGTRRGAEEEPASLEQPVAEAGAGTRLMRAFAAASAAALAALRRSRRRSRRFYFQATVAGRRTLLSTPPTPARTACGPTTSRRSPSSMDLGARIRPWSGAELVVQPRARGRKGSARPWESRPIERRGHRIGQSGAHGDPGARVAAASGRSVTITLGKSVPRMSSTTTRYPTIPTPGS